MLASEIAQIDHSLVHDEDLTLVLDAQHGSMAAFDELVKRHERRMFRIAHNLLHHRQDAEDAVQEAFFKAFRKLRQFQGRAKFATWLTRITVNQALAKLRREPTFWSSLAEGPQVDAEAEAGAGIWPQEIAAWDPNPETIYSTLELRKLLEKNLRRLSPKIRSVFLLHDVEGLSLEETAQALGLSVCAVKTRSRRARLQLREWLNRHFRTDIHAVPRQAGEQARAADLTTSPGSSALLTIGSVQSGGLRCD
jgi:RNA polymerase sigma-70 factor, ECF subfamily